MTPLDWCLLGALLVAIVVICAVVLRPEPAMPKLTPGLPPMSIEAARVTYLDAEGLPIGRPVVVTRTAVIETWERKPDGGLIYSKINVQPPAPSPPCSTTFAR